jgi:hypothetical protein
MPQQCWDFSVLALENTVYFFNGQWSRSQVIALFVGNAGTLSDMGQYQRRPEEIYVERGECNGYGSAGLAGW